MKLFILEIQKNAFSWGKKESLTKRDQEAFQICIDICQDLNDAIIHTIAKMGSFKKCRNSVQKSFALYVFLFLVFFGSKEPKNGLIKSEQTSQTFYSRFWKWILKLFK